MTTPIPLQKKRLKLWIKCLVLSLAVHSAIGGYLYHNPMLLSQPLQSLFGITLAEPKPFPHENDIDFINKNLLLEDVFSTVLVTPSRLHPPYDLADLPPGIALAPKEETMQPELAKKEDLSPFTALIDQKTLSKEAILKEMQEVSPSPLFHALEQEAAVASHIEIDIPLATIEVPFIEPVSPAPYDDVTPLAAAPSGAIAEKENKEGLLIQDNSPMLEKGNPSSIGLIQTQPQSLLAHEKKPSLFVPKSPPLSTKPRAFSLPQENSHRKQYSFPALSPSASWDEDFTVDVSFAPRPEGTGYLFALTLTPVKDLSDHQLKQNFYFILDRSSSSQKHRFPVFKRATLKALSSIQPGDCFNIFVIDKHVTKFSSENKPASLKNRRAAEEFLDAQEATWLFNNSHVYTSLTQILSLIPNNQEMHSVILLSDGQSNLNTKKRQEVFSRWITENEGKVTLYTAAVGKDNDLLSLDLISTESGGRLLYSDTHASFPRKLAKLILDLKAPLAKDIDIAVKPSQSASYIELYPAAYTLAPLYANEPYVILGEIDHLASFDLILEGRHKDDWISINKKISFKKATAADPQIVKQWKKTQASVCYAKFLEEGKPSHLKDAKEILNRSQREVAFQ